MGKLVCLLCFTYIYFSCQSAEAAPSFKSCNNWSKVVTNISVSPNCNIPCQLKKGTNVTVTVDFKSEVASKILMAKVYGVIGGIRVPFPLGNTNGCKNSGISCPTKKDGQYTYKNTIEVKKSYPALKLLVEWEMYGDGNEKVFCFVMPVEIVA